MIKRLRRYNIISILLTVGIFLALQVVVAEIILPYAFHQESLKVNLIVIDNLHDEVVLGVDVLIWVIGVVLVTLLIMNLISKIQTKRFIKKLELLAFGQKNGELNEQAVVKDFPELAPFFNRLSSLNERQSQFTANVSHQFRTPLTALSAQSQVVRIALKNGDNKLALTALEKIEARSNEMHGVVSAMLMLAKFDERKYHIYEEQVDLKVVIEQVVNDWKEYVDANISVTTSFSGTDFTIKSDKLLVNEIIKGLFSNAQKYCTSYVRISLTAVGETVSLCIENDGEPIPEHLLPYIFDRFFRTENAKLSKSGGYGIGLSIVKMTTKLLHANISATSTATEGTTFQVIFKKVLEEPWKQLSRTRLRKMREGNLLANS